MNVICGITAICLSTFLGYYLSGKWTDRKVFYSDLLNFHTKLVKEVEFSKKTLIDIAKEYKDETDFDKLLKNKYLDKNDSQFKLKYLSDEEKIFVENYLKDIGKTESQVENGYLLGMSEEIKNKATEAKSLEDKYKKLYIKVGFLLGLMLFIVLI